MYEEGWQREIFFEASRIGERRHIFDTFLFWALVPCYNYLLGEAAAPTENREYFNLRKR